ncbi:LysM peptidoglycan-binding domain-containing protein [Lysinibacillus yapensis]|uniref:LysM peptidoglycan-binding domain-containing protein n=1 Tax=Ureibacillus yapensis TaxID=2304605 RepID=A0A396S2Z5_9BACL|nr:LysM peptidoglycan-binding domain-containing protein [Lysinibacillus yapensis]RHW30952.1 LysM peptidoglycan-binding domain-containing protein [Lysinibacillus yapensis]
MKRKQIAALALSVIIATSTFAPFAQAKSSTYTVQSGDTLWKVSLIHSVSLDQLRKWNHLKSDVVHKGQKLTVSQSTSMKPVTKALSSSIKKTTTSSAVNSVTYTVKPGDTLWKVATANRTTPQALKSLNGLSSENIKVGQVLKLSGNTTAASIAQPKVQTATQTAKVHVVKAGETLSVIAKKYGTTINTINSLNALGSDRLSIGQELKVTAGEMPRPQAPSFLPNGTFPLKKGTYSPYGDSWGNSRTYGGTRTHEGTDIMAPKGTPVYSATSGQVANYGWNEFGGYQITIKTADGYNLYYAHLSKYASGIKKGSIVQEGQLIGYVGDTGYGTEGTSGKFSPHLHFAIYNSNWAAVNPYSNLRFWESN